MPGDASAALAAAESSFADLREIDDDIGVARERGVASGVDGQPLSALVTRYPIVRSAVATRLAGIDTMRLSDEDRHAVRAMQHALAGELASPSAADSSGKRAGAAAASACTYDVAALLRDGNARETLSDRIYQCYAQVATHIVSGRDTLDRLTILGNLARIDDPRQRQTLWLALDTVWRSVNGDDSPRGSPFRALTPLVAQQWRERGSPIDAAARGLGMDAAELERRLVELLERWREVTPASLIQPWDYYYVAGEASRRLSGRIALADLSAINERWYASLGASPARLGVGYDLVPRPGQTAVAFTTFARRGRDVRGVWRPTVPWVFAPYRVGGFDNLQELLHETGHAVHIAAIRTRPAFEDWPDSDPFTEGLGDLMALEAYEPAWQQQWLGDSVSTRESLRAKYSGIMLDVAWALFELRMYRAPETDPNTLWTELTERYLHIAPHPDRSWWAMRGQLIDAPGYMTNYALGAIIIADIRQRMHQARGPMTARDSTWYDWVAPRLYRFGLERPSREVIESFLGRPVAVDALLKDLGRMEGK